jgi:hypothetical protein
VLYNIGQAELALDRPQLAIETLRRYLAEGGEQIDPARRAEVVSTITTELERLGPVEAVNETLGRRSALRYGAAVRAARRRELGYRCGLRFQQHGCGGPAREADLGS